jgi:hypothetical protein
VVLEYEKLVATEVVVVDIDVVVDDDVVVVLYVVMVVANVTPKKFDAKSSVSPAGHAGPVEPAMGGTLHAMIDIR